MRGARMRSHNQTATTKSRQLRQQRASPTQSAKQQAGGGAPAASTTARRETRGLAAGKGAGVQTGRSIRVVARLDGGSRRRPCNRINGLVCPIPTRGRHDSQAQAGNEGPGRTMGRPSSPAQAQNVQLGRLSPSQQGRLGSRCSARASRGAESQHEPLSAFLFARAVSMVATAGRAASAATLCTASHVTTSPTALAIWGPRPWHQSGIALDGDAVDAEPRESLWCSY
jgi:hypothetical protein